MKLDLPPSDSDSPKARLPYEASEPAEAHDIPASIDDTELHYPTEEDESVPHDHLEGHDEVEPHAMRDAHRRDDSVTHSQMRLAQDERSEGSNVELFERDEPVSPFGG